MRVYDLIQATQNFTHKNSQTLCNHSAYLQWSVDCSKILKITINQVRKCSPKGSLNYLNGQTLNSKNKRRMNQKCII